MNRLPLTALTSVLFFVSGGTALAYQVIWFKRFSHLWGSSSLAMAGVVAGFLLGLGLGARWLGGLADRVRSPLRTYGVFEVGIALLALAVPFELAWLQSLAAGVYDVLQPHPSLHTLVRFLAAFVVLGPPCMLMGATLPLLVRQFVVRSGGVTRATGWFYAINTAGAAAGCFLTGFHLLPTYGLASTHQGAVAVNIFVGLIAIVLGGGAGEREETLDEPPSRPVRRLPLGVRLAALFTGAAALMLQMVWMRQLALLLGGTTYAFTAVVLVVLIGIGLGSLLLRLGFQEKSDGRGLFTAVTIGVALTTVLGQLALPQLAEYAGAVRAQRADAGFNAMLCVGVSMVLELAPSLGAGLLFPLLVHFTGARHADAGRAVGRIYAWNTAGTTLGGILPSLVLFSLVGTAATLAGALLLYLSTPFLLAGRSVWSRRKLLPVAHVAAFLLVPMAAVRETPELYYGLYIYGPEAIDQLAAAQELYHREGPTCDITVREYEGERSLQVNGKTDASTHAAEQSAQLGLGYLPRLLRPDAKDLCIIGYGSGATAGASLLFPVVERLDCLEIEPAVFEASRFFEAINRRPQSFAAFHPITDDGRSHIQATSQDYDLIVTEPSNPWLAGISNLFTREFYVAVKARLRPDGMVCQWIQTYALSANEYELIVRTMTDVFPHCMILWLDEGNTMFLASEDEILPGPEEVDRVQAMIDASPTARAELDAYFGFRDARSLFLQHVLLSEEAVKAWMLETEGGELNTDWNMRLEFDAPLQLFAGTSQFGFELSTELMSRADPGFTQRLFEALGCGPEQTPGLRSRIRQLATYQRQDLAGLCARFGLERAPGDPGLLADALVFAPPYQDEDFRTEADIVIEGLPFEANRVALSLAERGQLDRAIYIMRALADRFQDAAVWCNLTGFYQRAGDLERARATIASTLEWAPTDPGALKLAANLGVRPPGAAASPRGSR